MPKYSILFCRFPGNNIDDPDTTDYFAECMLKAKGDSRISEFHCWRKSDTPITMVRNLACEEALRLGVDFIFMLDNDMKMDAYLSSNPNRLAVDPRAKPFWETALEFLLQHDGPASIGVPYCGPPPIENIYVFKWANYASAEPPHSSIDGFKMEQFQREEAAIRGGIEEVAALPTGGMMFHTSALKRVPKPYFAYEYRDASESEKATTEDVYMTRNLSFAGVPQYVAWDCWAGHWKRKCVGKPLIKTVDMVREDLRESILGGRRSGEQLVMLGEGKSKPKHRPLVEVNGK